MERRATRSQKKQSALRLRPFEAEQLTGGALTDAGISAGVAPHAGVAILAAADPVVKAAVAAVLDERSELDSVVGAES